MKEERGTNCEKQAEKEVLQMEKTNMGHEVITQNITTILGTKISMLIISDHYSFVEGQSSAFFSSHLGLGSQNALVVSLTSWLSFVFGSVISITSALSSPAARRSASFLAASILST